MIERQKPHSESWDTAHTSTWDIVSSYRDTSAQKATNVLNHSTLIDTHKCQFDDILQAYFIEKRPLECEALGTYAADYDFKNGIIFENNLVSDDVIGLAITQWLQEYFPQAKMYSLLDTYHTMMPDTTDPSGKPIGEIDWVIPMHLQMSPEAKQAFKSNFLKLLKNRNIDTSPEKYVLLDEGDKVFAAEKIVAEIEVKSLEEGKSFYLENDGEKIVFHNPDAENPDFQKIQLRNANGKWTCQALDAASYQKAENLDITHLVILPSSMRSQQDQVWELLRVLGIQNKHYHNIFFDTTADAEKIVDAITDEFEASMARVFGENRPMMH